MSASDRSTVSAVRGPITLITVGALFALQNFTGYGFDQTWPVLLIVFGLLSLLARGTRPVPTGASTSAPPAWPGPAPAETPAPPSYRQSHYQEPAPPAKGGFGTSAPPRAPEPGPNPPSGPTGEAL
jgi:hypothetical protein